MKKMNKKGFTIVELTIVIAVIAILSAALVPSFSNIVKNAKDTAAVQSAQNAYTEYLSDVKIENGESPADYMLYQAASDKFIAIKNGNIVLNDGKPFTSDDAAIKAILDDPATDANEAEGYTATGLTEGKLVKVIKN